MQGLWVDAIDDLDGWVVVDKSNLGTTWSGLSRLVASINRYLGDRGRAGPGRGCHGGRSPHPAPRAPTFIDIDGVRITALLTNTHRRSRARPSGWSCVAEH